MSTDLGFTQRYLMRRAAKDGDTVQSTLPPQVIRRAARIRGLTLNEFIAKYRVEFIYDGVDDGFWGRFVERQNSSLEQALKGPPQNQFIQQSPAIEKIKASQARLKALVEENRQWIAEQVNAREETKS